MEDRRRRGYQRDTCSRTDHHSLGKNEATPRGRTVPAVIGLTAGEMTMEGGGGGSFVGWTVVDAKVSERDLGSVPSLGRGGQVQDRETGGRKG